MQFSTSDRGFTLIELIMGTGLLALIILMTAELSSRAYLPIKRLNLKDNMIEIRRTLMRELRNDCSWENSIQDLNNTNLNCLRTGTDCSLANGSFLLKDRYNTDVYDSTLPQNGFNKDGIPCSSYDGLNGSDVCPLRVDLSWEPMCQTPACTKPIIKISGIMQYKPTQQKFPINTLQPSFEVIRDHIQTYTSCKTALDAGETVSGLYTIDPDGAGSECPFQVYCDMTADGGGWSLVVSAPTPGYTSMPEANPPITPGSHGRLSDLQLSSILSGVDLSGPNNARIRVLGAPSGDMVVSMKIDGQSSKGMYSTTDLLCGSYNPGPDPISFSSESTWSFIARDGATNRIGFSDESGLGIAAAGYNGFTCNNCSGGNACTAPPGGCCDGALKGELWLR